MDANDESHTDSLERDLETTEWVLVKVRASCAYAQALYAALCNNDFTPNRVWDILCDLRCSFSWRHAGHIIADMRGEGDYIDWYCSGVGPYLSPDADVTMQSYDSVPEGHVTDEIREDLLKLGWIVVKSPD